MWRSKSLRVGVYVDALNLYYGARTLCGRESLGWRWLDIEALADAIVARYEKRFRIKIIHYCTAEKVDPATGAKSEDQQSYLEALRQNSLINVEVGYFAKSTKKGFLAAPGKHYRRDSIYQLLEGHTFHEDLPLSPARDPQGRPALVCKVWTQEEKGSDVNLATHLVHDVTARIIDVAVVITNDGDQALPLRLARQSVRVITVNPSGTSTSQPLMGNSDSSRFGHRWLGLTAQDYLEAQFAARIAGIEKPSSW